jgi:hypothetical protein
LQPVIDTFRQFGVTAEYKPINDIVNNGRKISGTGAAQVDEMLILVGNFIQDFNYEIMSKCLRAPDEKFRDKVHKTMYENLTTFLRETGSIPANADLAAASGFEVVTIEPDHFYAQRLDAVDICTPNNLHFSQAQQVLAAGVAVYCEKPLAMNYHQALELADLADSRQAITQFAYGMRYSPAIRQVKSLLEDGLIGNILHFRAFKYHASYLDIRRPITWRLRFDQSGGGLSRNWGVTWQIWYVIY